LPIPSPFGTFNVPNISPDPNDGIGRWSEADFVTAVLKGTSPSGFHYFPAFPYASYEHAKFEDIRGIGICEPQRMDRQQVAVLGCHVARPARAPGIGDCDLADRTVEWVASR